MSNMITALLYAFLAAEVLSVLMAFTEAKKPRDEVEPGAACLGAGLIMVCAAPVALLLITPQPERIKYLAAWLALTMIYDAVQFVRQVHGVRGPRTPVTTTVAVLTSMTNMAVIGWILLAGV